MTPTDPADDPRVLELARQYLADLEAGRTPDRRTYEGRHPDLAAAVAECLDGVELAHAAGRAMRPPSPAAVAAPEHPTEPLGDFRIVREIGRGGMGVVYEAVQLSLGRRVALKVLPFAAGLDAKQLQRFKTEAHAAAQLHHTNIVPVYAVGCERGTHFYAMQLIDGRPLDSLIRDLRGDAPVHTGNTTLDFRLSTTAPTAVPEPTRTASATTGTKERHRTAARLALQVAEALEYAHDAGVVHRDVKPANLLLDPKGTVWVTDFGLAQVTAEAGMTRTGDIFGTLRYMSPEQAAGRRVLVDHRTDVYSLGATLYELLTLHPIFPGTDRQSLLHAILTDDPAPPRRHDRTVPPELETIVLKATAKLPQERYATAGELAADLRRFLDDRPILARRPTVLDHVRKWLRRHPAYTRAGLAVLVLTAAGLAVSTALIAREKGRTDDALGRERQRAREAEEAANEAKRQSRLAERAAAEAEEQFQVARKAVDEMIRVANEELANDPVQKGLRRKLLASVLAYYQEFIELRQNDPKAKRELEDTQAQVTAILSELTTMQGAEKYDLLRDRGVQGEIGLTDEQKKRVDGLFPRPGGLRGGPLHDFNRLSPEQRAKRLDQLKELDGAITPLLTPTQATRLDQLALQSRGPMAFREPEVIAALKLTADQRDRMRDIGFGLRGPAGRGEGGRGGRGGGEREFDLKAMMDRVLGVLTAEQSAAWDQMTGPPSSVPLPIRLGFGGFGGPPPDGPPPFPRDGDR
jgi:hypothetical protein